MVKARERNEAYAQGLLDVARGEGPLAEIEDDLFRFARTVQSSDDLRMSLGDPKLPIERRLALINELLDGKALPASTALISMVVAAGHADDLPSIVERFVELAAAEREQELAEVRSAIALDPKQTKRLADALSKATGKRVEIKVIIDPSVLGGIIARIGDTVIDGSVRHRLEQLKEQV